MTPDALESLCLSLKGTTVDVKWGNDLCYLVGGKMYCVYGIEGPFKVSFKVTPEDFSALTERKGIIAAPYLARYQWILIEDSSALKSAEWKHLIRQSYQLVIDKLPKKLKP